MSHLWIWGAIIAIAALMLLFAYCLGKIASDADEAVARMRADRCPDELEP